MDPAWYYEERPGERAGPVSPETIARLRDEGTLAGDTLVWREGLPGWIPFARSELARATARTGEDATGTEPGRLQPPPVPKRGPKPPPPPPSALPRPVHQPRPARLRDDSRVRIGSCFARGWKLMVANFWPFIGMYALASILVGVAAQLFVPIFFLTLPILAGCYFSFLKSMRHQQAVFDDLFEGFRRRFGDLALVNLALSVPFLLILTAGCTAMIFGLVAIAEHADDPTALGIAIGGTVLGLFTLFLAASFFGAIGCLISILCLDCEASGGQALALGWRAFRRHPFSLIVFGAVATFLSFAGLFALYFGSFVTSAWSAVATVVLYEDLFGDETDSAGGPVSADPVTPPADT